MTGKRAVLLSAIVAFGLGLNSGASAQPPGKPAEATAPTKPKGVSRTTVITVHGKIVAVNKKAKSVTLEGPKGRKVTLRVENPYNLKAAKVGEPVVARFYEVVTIRKKKPGETVPSASLSEGIATAQPGQVPGAVVGQRVRLVVSVVGIDMKDGTVSVKGPDGVVETVKARNPKNLKLIKVGDDLVVTLSRAIAISLEKGPAS